MPEEFGFVIMPFDPQMQPVYDDAIKPAVESHGLKCVRVDEISGTGNIVRRIIENICRARVVIADLTGKNANVFYELGIAHSLGNNVIVLAQDIGKDVPFDVKNYKVIPYSMTWRGDKVLRDQIQEAIATLGDWSRGPSNPVQDFLPAEARPVPQARHAELQHDLAQAHIELHELRNKSLRLTELEKELQIIRASAVQSTSQREELERLRTEVGQLRIVQQFAELLFSRISDGEDFETVIKRYQAEKERQGEVTVQLPTPADDRTTSKDKKIIFRPVPNDKAKRK